jgi:hypothetical protein
VMKVGLAEDLVDEYEKFIQDIKIISKGEA